VYVRARSPKLRLPAIASNWHDLYPPWIARLSPRTNLDWLSKFPPIHRADRRLLCGEGSRPPVARLRSFSTELARARDFVGIAAHRGNLKRLSRFSSVRKTIGASRVYYGSILRLHVSVPRSLMETTCWKLRMRFEDNSMSGRA